MSFITGSVENRGNRHRGFRNLQVRPVFYICLVVLVCKLAFFLADPYPSFHFGDSGAYLATALIKWIPPDRSFSYGFLLRSLVIRSHSFGPVLAVQIVGSGLASIILGLLLIGYFRTKTAVAVVCAGLSAIEPLQLMSERFVMTEALATFGFAIYLALALSFLVSRRTVTLIGVQVVGTVLVSLRYSFLPLVLILSVGLPILAGRRTWRASWRSVVVQLCIAVLASQLLLAGYRHLYGYLAHTKPAYLSRDGEFLLADMAPIILPKDFPIPDERDELFGRVKIPLSDINNRPLQRWGDLGLCHAILDVAKQDEDVANVLARRTALHAMRRDPIGVLRLGLSTYRQFLTYKKLRWALQLNQGHFSGPTKKDIDTIRAWFGVDALDRRYSSITKVWQGNSVPWCWVVVLLPWFYAGEMIWKRNRVSEFDWLLLIAAFSSLTCATIPVENPNPRYLVPLPWLSILILGVISSRFSSAASKMPHK